MISLNTTFHVDEDIHLRFLEYMIQTYIANAKNDDQILNIRFFKVHSNRIEEGHSYSVQLSFNTLDELENWDQTKGRKLNEDLLKSFDDKIAGFSTLLEEIKF